MLTLLKYLFTRRKNDEPIRILGSEAFTEDDWDRARQRARRDALYREYLERNQKVDEEYYALLNHRDEEERGH